MTGEILTYPSDFGDCGSDGSTPFNYLSVNALSSIDDLFSSFSEIPLFPQIVAAVITALAVYFLPCLAYGVAAFLLGLS